ncbi:MAG: hypothetical protein ABIK08_12475, partial [Pseudomonadota bacterium]
MHVRLTALAAALMVSVTPAWATDLPAYETYSAAADFGTNFFSSDPTYTQLLDTTTTPGATAQISGSGYTASASTNMGSNHAYASASTMPANVLSAGGFSGWYDQVTITGGSGTGTANFTVQLSGTADVGAMAGGLGYTLGVSSVHPSLLTSNTLAFNAINTTPWALDAATPIASYLIGASPYNDTSILFSSTSYPTDPTSGGIPALDPSLGGGTGMGFPAPDLVLTPGSGQSVNITLHGTLNFTYGEASLLTNSVFFRRRGFVFADFDSSVLTRRSKQQFAIEISQAALTQPRR